MSFFSKGLGLLGGGSSNPFSMFDKNGDGKITEEDFVLAIQKFGLGSIGNTAIRFAFKQLDKNHNGQLEMSEALAALEMIKKLKK